MNKMKGALQKALASVAAAKKEPQPATKKGPKKEPKKEQTFKRDAEEKPVSPALAQALAHVKDFMTDSQKAGVLMREGKSLLDSGDVKGAIECFNEGISFNPTVSLFSLRASAHKSLDMHSEAYFDYSYNIRLEPENGAHYCNRGMCLAKLRKISMALEDLEIAIQLEPSLSHYYTRATTYAEFGKFDLAIADFTVAIGDESLQLTELKMRCKYRRALAYFEIGQFDDVVRDTNAILAQDTNSVQTRALLGRALKILNDHKKAEEHLSVAILLDSAQANLYTERGDIRFRTGQRIKIIEAIYDFDKAVDILDKKLENKPLPAHLDVLASSLMMSRRTLLHRKSSYFTLKPAERTDSNAADEGVMISASNLQISHRKGSFVQNQKPRSASALPTGGSFNMDREKVTPGYYKDMEEQLADALFKRAQAKLMADPDQVNVESALVDALRALVLHGDDDDYHMVACTCYMRLNRYSEALKMLTALLARSPSNQKALYHLAFCQRAAGDQKDAIEGLTKIIALDGGVKAGGAEGQDMPIHRVYEMRGTLFHEIQAHKLALLDLGKAIAINPAGSDNYFLRGDCHCKLGNYEQALGDFDIAEANSFEDKGSLYIARGGVKRLLSLTQEAQADYQKAYDALDRGDKIGKVRILSFRSFCKIDQGHFRDAYDCLVVAKEFNKEIILEKMSAFTSNIEKVEQLIQQHLKKHGQSWHSRPLSSLEGDILYLKRIDWILQYHLALCAYMQQDYPHCERILEICLKEDNVKFIPDDNSLGTQLFFLAQCQVQAKKWEAAAESIDRCLQTPWVGAKRNRFMVQFSLGKVYQAMGRHEEAIGMFNTALDSEESSHVYFRRAWSYKALGDYVAAGDDFETAKRLSPDDPNFALHYRRISNCAYMEVGSDPDLCEVFPALLPVPGLATR